MCQIKNIHQRTFKELINTFKCIVILPISALLLSILDAAFVLSNLDDRIARSPVGEALPSAPTSPTPVLRCGSTVNSCISKAKRDGRCKRNTFDRRWISGLLGSWFDRS